MAPRAVSPERRPERRIVPLPDGRHVAARVWPGRGTPLVCLHGLLDSAAGWDTLGQGTTRPCVALDLGGFGSSDLPVRPAFSAYAEDVLEALSGLVPGPFVLVGHSLGGGVATAVAERAPDRVRALVLLAPAGFGRIPLAEAISLPGVRGVAAQVLPLTLLSRPALTIAYRTFVTNGLDPEDAIVAQLRTQPDDLARAAVCATKAVVRAGVSRHGFSRRPVTYPGPVHVVWGTHDRVVPLGHLDAVRRALPQARSEIWRGMGHHPQRERPVELAQLVERAARTSAPPRATRARAAA